MNKKVNVIDNASATIAKKRSIIVPAACAFACAGLLFWTFNHLSGGCLNAIDALSFCDGTIVPLK